MPGTSSHTRIRLSGKGLKKVNGFGHGDHYVHFKILVPKRLKEKQKALVHAYAELEDDTPGQILGVTFRKDGSKYFVSKPEDLLESLRSALNDNSKTKSDKETNLDNDKCTDKEQHVKDSDNKDTNLKSDKSTNKEPDLKYKNVNSKEEKIKSSDKDTINKQAKSKETKMKDQLSSDDDNEDAPKRKKMP